MKLNIRRAVPLEELIRIDVHRHGNVFGERQFIQGLADESTEPHDSLASHQDVKPKLAL